MTEEFERVPWGSQNGTDVYVIVYQQMEQYRIKTARIMTPPGYVPKEVSVIWETHSDIHSRRVINTRGLLSQRYEFLEMLTETGKDWKYLTYTMSDDCLLSAFLSESRELGHKRDVIQFGLVKFNQTLYNLIPENNMLHGPIHVTNPNSHFKFSPEPNRKFLYFAQPTQQQLKTKNRQDRRFVICVYDFETRGTTIITDENLCEDTINSVEWTPDGNGIVFHRSTELVWHRFGEPFVNIIFPVCPNPERISFSPEKHQLAVFFTANHITEHSIILFHWPFVKAAVNYHHNVISLGNHNVWKVPERPWAFGGKRLVFNVNWQNDVNVYSLATDTLSLDKFAFQIPSMVVDVLENELLIETIAANSATRLWIISLVAPPNENQYSVSLLTVRRPGYDGIHHFDVKCLHFDNNSFTAILYIPNDSHKPGEKLPMIVAPHGGKDPNFTKTSVDPIYSTFVTMGYCVLVINYRNKYTPYIRGFPEKPDFKAADDCHAAVLTVLEQNHYRIDENEIRLFGYEYGSFVAGTMLIRYQNYYKCACFFRQRLEIPDQYIDEEDEESKVQIEKQLLSNVDEVNIPILFMVDENEEMMYEELEASMTQRQIPIFVEYVENDQDYNDFIVKFVNFFDDPIQGPEKKLFVSPEADD
uniref:Acylaminoacyl-peptidase n=1 Tax=Caenorhabditis tropicalis TaxID=1561998 RepID=A0A1I7TC79_9PELO